MQLSKTFNYGNRNKSLK